MRLFMKILYLMVKAVKMAPNTPQRHNCQWSILTVREFFIKIQLTRVTRLPTSEFFQVFQPLFLVHVSMEREGVSFEEGEDGDQAPNTVLTVGKNKSTTWILDQEVVQVQILQWREKSHEITMKWKMFIKTRGPCAPLVTEATDIFLLSKKG